MTRVLVLFTSASVEEKKAYPDTLKQLLEAQDSSLKIDTAVYDDIVYELAPGRAKAVISTTGTDIADYDVVYVRRIKESTAQAIAVGKYCRVHGVPVLDAEIADRPGSMGKLTQYMQLALHDLPFPKTLYSSSHQALVAAFDRSGWQFPVILKSVSGSRGADNYLITNHEELDETLNTNPDVHFLIQKYVANAGDYRVWICGGQVGPILYRSRLKGHMNNTSQGGGAELVGMDSLPQKVLDDCVRAAALFERDIAGVDVVFEHDDPNGNHYFFEVNRAPQVENTPFSEVKAKALAEYFILKAKDKKQ